MKHTLALAVFVALSTTALRAENPFLGRWALTIPGGGAGWLGVEQKDGQLSSSVLWGGGSVVPTTATAVEGDKLIVTRVTKSKKKDGTSGEPITETITAIASGDDLKLATVKTKPDGKPFAQAQFAGKRIPAVPARPDLTKVRFGNPIDLFNGKDLTGWRLIKAESDNGWSVKDGLLQNRVVKTKDKHFGNLRTDAEFEDFNLKVEVSTVEGSNSGIYLRGIYEVQIMESFGKPLDSHHMGALYSRITPSVNAEKPIGEWQTLDITLVDRHLTVILNGKTIIDNQP
ncbi:MAG: 3-keto-disaccharide hydrolase, partial [Verrucomicrobiaceae bacterium]